MMDMEKVVDDIVWSGRRPGVALPPSGDGGERRYQAGATHFHILRYRPGDGVNGKGGRKTGREIRPNVYNIRRASYAGVLFSRPAASTCGWYSFCMVYS